MVRAAGLAGGMTVPRMAVLAVAVTGMVVAAMLLMIGLSRRGTGSTPGHRVRARTRHNRPGPRPSAAALSARPPAQRPPAAPLNLRRPAQRPSATSASLRPPARASQDWADQEGSYGYGRPSRWGDAPDDPRGWQ